MKRLDLHIGILGKLLIAFFVTMLVLAGAMHFLFRGVFFRRTYEKDLQSRTADAAARVSACMQDEVFFNAFLEKDLTICAEPLDFLGDYSALEYAEVWVVAGETIMVSYNAEKNALEFDEIPTRYHPMVQTIFTGQMVGDAKYASVWNRDMFGVGAPVLNRDGEVIAAVITQISRGYVRAAISSADTALLMSCAAAMVVSAAIAILLAGYFAAPLRRMRTAAQRWETEDYAPRTGVTRKDEFGQLAQSMDELAERLGREQERRTYDEKARRQFFADVSHELKTPVAVLRAQLEMLRDGIVSDPDERRSCLVDSLDEIAQMQRLIEDLLTLSKLQNPEFQMRLEPVCLCDVLRDIRHSRGPISAQRGVTLDVRDVDECSDRRGCTVDGDYTRIRQLLNILIDNAERYTPSGGTIQMRFDVDQMEISVVDNGPGMSPEDLEHIFDRYYSHYHSAGGSGLGLPIARQIALRHNAELTITSQAGEGTCAVVRFERSAGAL